MSAGQHRRTNEPLKDRFVKFILAASIAQTGSHRRRKQAAANRSSRGSSLDTAQSGTAA